MNADTNKVLLVTKQELLIDVVSVYLEGWAHAEIEVADTSLKLEQCLAEGSSRGWSLVILEDDRLLHSAGKSIIDFMCPTIVIGREPSSPPPAGRRVIYLRSPIDLGRLSESIQQQAGAGAAPPREYCAVRPDILVMSGKELGQDVYLQRSDGGYELAFRKGEKIEFGEALFARLAGRKHLFMKNADFQNFLRALAEEMQELSGKTHRVFDLGASVNLTASVHEMLSEALPELGFTVELQRATKASIDIVVNAIRKDPRLADLLEQLTKNEAEYLSWHSTTLCYLACRLSSLMTWDSSNTHYKLSLAAFLHDLTLRSKTLQRARSLEEAAAIQATQAERDEFREHPHSAAALARAMKDYPGDVDHIIAQHHELPSGKGFPLGITHTKISPLAAVFIVAHELTDELYEKRGNLRLRDSVANLEKIYTQGYFKRVIAALKELCVKEVPL